VRGSGQRRIIACRRTHAQEAISQWTSATHNQTHKTTGGVCVVVWLSSQEWRRRSFWCPTSENRVCVKSSACLCVESTVCCVHVACVHEHDDMKR